ncbi:MAG TPA: hypothetical protein VNE41_03955 [Chitinophagaceae bacterium]|nr:hypothetical protein [Chitinophagaceae bacterium]
MYNIFDYAIELFFVWLIYKLVVEFIVPVYRSTKHIRKQMHDVHRNMQDQFRQQQQTPSNNPPPQPGPPIEKEGEYIEFEEVK